MEFSAAMKSSRHWACLCNSSEGLSCSSVTPRFLASAIGVKLIHQRLAGALQQLEVAILNGIDARFDFFFREVMARLTGAVDVEQRTANPVIGNFCRPIALIGHVAIGTRNSRPGMNPLAPELELGMLRFQNFRAGFCVLVVIKSFAVGKFAFVPVLFDLLRSQSLAPGKLQGQLARAVILDMALPADERPHLRA